MKRIARLLAAAFRQGNSGKPMTIVEHGKFACPDTSWVSPDRIIWRHGQAAVK